jgi:hypothetical protein
MLEQELMSNIPKGFRVLKVYESPMKGLFKAYERLLDYLYYEKHLRDI